MKNLRVLRADLQVFIENPYAKRTVHCNFRLYIIINIRFAYTS